MSKDSAVLTTLAADAIVQTLALPGSPVRRAKTMMDAGNPRGIFEAMLWLHLEYGVVISKPDCFLMGRPVERNAPGSHLLSITHRFEKPNAWYVWCMAGNPCAAMLAMPHQLEFIGFRRRGAFPNARIHWHRTYWLRRKLYEADTRRLRKEALRGR
jgi:hypothetical protein